MGPRGQPFSEFFIGEEIIVCFCLALICVWGTEHLPALWGPRRQPLEQDYKCSSRKALLYSKTRPRHVCVTGGDKGPCWTAKPLILPAAGASSALVNRKKGERMKQETNSELSRQQGLPSSWEGSRCKSLKEQRLPAAPSQDLQLWPNFSLFWKAFTKNVPVIGLSCGVCRYSKCLWLWTLPGT